MKNLVQVTLGLCAGRHSFPECVTGYVFPETLPAGLVTNPDGLEDYASSRISEACAPFCQLQYTGRTCYDYDHYGEDETVLDVSNVHIVLYASGLTVALLAAINACRVGGVGRITVMHYDRETGTYYPQEVK